MKFSCTFYRGLHWVNLPGALLIALLQRTPVLQMGAMAEEMVVSSPIGAVLKSVAATVASLGALHSLAGATTLTTNSHPSPLTATAGTAIPTVVFGVSGTDAQAGSWQVANGSAIPPGLTFGGLTGPGTINISNPSLVGTPTTAGTYSLILQAFEGPNRTLTQSPIFTYTVVVTGGVTASAPTITTQPVDQVVNQGTTVIFTVVASGSPAPTYQWRKNLIAISGATSSSLTLANVTSADIASYNVLVTNSAGSVVSNSALLTVIPTVGNQPTFSFQPQSVTVNLGSTAVLSATAANALTYQWKKDGATLFGAVNDILILQNVTLASAGSYTVDAISSAGTVTSAPAILGVANGAVSRIANLSVRTTLAASQILTVGFVTNGTKNLLLRAVGPSLKTVFNLDGFYPDPQETVFNQSGVTLDQNDNWPSTLSSTFAALGAFPLAVGSKDAALLRSINGPNTAQISGIGPGVVLVEVYDADAVVFSRLTNVSARNQIGTGANILISGFVIDGPVAKTLLIRGIGPALKDVFGVAGAITDPILEIHQTVNGQDTILARNDNWSINLAPTFARVGAYSFGTNSKDSALLLTLPPGVYTAQVSGVNSVTGDGVVEVYEVP